MDTSLTINGLDQQAGVSSLFNMASGIAEFCGGLHLSRIRMELEDLRLLYFVRNPFLSRYSEIGMVAGMIAAEEELVIESLMPDGGAIFPDGIESDYLQFNSGATARIRGAESRVCHILTTCPTIGSSPGHHGRREIADHEKGSSGHTQALS